MKHAARAVGRGLLFTLLAPPFASLALGANEYQIDLTVDPAAGILHGIERVVYKNETEAPLDTLFLEAPGVPGNPPQTGEARWKIVAVVDSKGKNSVLAWKGEESAYTVALASPLQAGFKTNLTVEYERSLAPADQALGYLDLNDRDGATWYLKFRAYRAGSLGSDDFKDISVTVTAPAGWIIASTGTSAGKGASPGNKTVLAAKSTRNFALALSDRFKVSRGSAGPLPVLVYAPEGDESWAGRALSEASEAASYYQSFLGAYPPAQISVLPGASGESRGSSSSQVIYAPTGVGDEALRDAISLRAARLVWGWSVGDPSDATPFVANGLAIWCQQNYLGKKYGRTLDAQYLQSGINDTYLVGVLRGCDTTLLRGRADRAKLDWDFERIVAQAKSAAVMHMLGGLLGEDKLLEIARGILKTSRQSILTDRDFQKLAQAATPTRLDGVFDQWLRTKDSLDYYLSHVRVIRSESGWEVHADVWKTGSAAMPVEIVAEDQTGAKVRSLFPADRASGEMAIPLKAPLASIALDPLQHLPLVARVGAGGRLDLAESLMAEGKLLRADEQVDQVLSDEPNHPRALFTKGRILKERGDWSGALAVWRKIPALAPSPEDPWRIWSQLWTARLDDLQGKRTEATAIYTSLAGLPDFRGSKAAAQAGLQSPFTDSWPPRVP
jgi:hypothetical protein